VLLLALVPAAASCSRSDDVDATDASPVLVEPTGDDARESGAARDRAARRDSMVLNFSGQGTDLLTISGDRRLRVSMVAHGDGEVVATGDAPDGQAIRFPTFDPQAADFAILRVVSRGLDDVLSPADRDFAFGADVAIDDVTTGSAADNGDNIIQRGLYQSSSQYKIQVDDGSVSCRVAGVTGEAVVYSPGRLHPGDWYRIRCERSGNHVTLAVAPLTASGPGKWLSHTKTGAIGPVIMLQDMPLSVGGKLSWDGDLLPSSTDQYNGRIDHVFYQRG
jgi:hypothetical protein